MKKSWTNSFNFCPGFFLQYLVVEKIMFEIAKPGLFRANNHSAIVRNIVPRLSAGSHCNQSRTIPPRRGLARLGMTVKTGFHTTPLLS